VDFFVILVQNNLLFLCNDISSIRHVLMYWQWLRPSLGKKWRVLRNSSPCGQDCKHTGLVS